MKRIKLMFLVIGAAIIFSGCSKDDYLAPELDQTNQAESALKAAKKPAAHLTGVMALDFNLLFLDNPALPVWEGTITFEGPGEYGMRFYSLSAPRDYSKARPFKEKFEIFDLGDGTVVLAGHDAGVTTLANSKYRMNGQIELANDPFEEWMGRKVHMSGEITWLVLQTPDGPVTLPETAPGIFRIN